MLGTKIRDFQKLLVNRKELLFCIFITLIIQGIVTTIVFNKVREQANSDLQKQLRRLPVLIGIVVLNICLLLLMALDSVGFYMKFVIFLVFSSLQGVFLGGTLKYLSESVIKAALYSTISIFIFFLVVGFLLAYFKIDISGLGLILFICLLLLIIGRITTIFLKSSEFQERTLTIFGLILFSMYIVYNTNNILLKYRNGNIDCIRGAVDYYLDIINIFIRTINR